MRIVLASTSTVKLSACREAFGNAADIIVVKASSGISEQPMNTETLTGAFNRLRDAKRQVPDADLYISVENGIFEENGKFIDRPVIVISRNRDAPETTFGEGVEFPKECVEETRARGFDKWTVGKIMQEKGLVKEHDDPHLDLAGKSRKSLLVAAIKQAIR